MVAAKRVLVVDDEEIVRESYRLALTDAGYMVQAVGNGRDALQACRSDRYDVLLADLRMPDMDGMEVSQAVRKEFPEVRIIIITGYPSPETLAQATQLGVSDYLEKPIGPDRLSEATAVALSRPPAKAPPDVPAVADRLQAPPLVTPPVPGGWRTSPRPRAPPISGPIWLCCSACR